MQNKFARLNVPYTVNNIPVFVLRGFFRKSTGFAQTKNHVGPTIFSADGPTIFSAGGPTIFSAGGPTILVQAARQILVQAARQFLVQAARQF